ncbi:lytic transglycosylase domain-containing protein [Streptomyces sp. XD-27]|uniref:lytic transglycosylase domain-containing protein n=1 Tax=Streptomyces sp. XD-27 TaxID=3062779 RepID=UPI0026F4349F|nr:lytic murein transglycosylase [Streptomyces sp. XD-27]WKX69757.1 lytic transglycosylase [Streptomyces sp. XD-27]
MAARFGRRLRKGAATTAVAAIAMAALTASQAPGFADTLHHDRDRQAEGAAVDPPAGTPIDGGSSYHTDLPPLPTPDKPAAGDGSGGDDDPAIGAGPAQRGIPATVLDAYKRAEAELRRSKPGCNLPWQLLAAIGKVESGQARGGAVDAQGTTRTPILGPQLNGNGFARITDTDGGAYDGDTTHDRAVGPMQFIPSTWENWGKDANGDGERDPNNIYDAALAAGGYLCAGGRDLSDTAHLHRAILGYNHSQEYLRTVLSWFEFYKNGTHEVPDGTGVLPSGTSPSGSSGKNKGNGGKGDGGNKDKNKGKDESGKGDDGKGTPPSPKPRPGGGDGPTPPGGDGKPTPGPTDPSTPAPAPVTGLVSVDVGELTATAGTEFARSPQVRAEDAAGKPVKGVRVQYEIRGETDAVFPRNARRVNAVTGADGIATAPKLRAGQRTGSFTVRATVVGRDIAAADVTATVTAPPRPQADALSPVDVTDHQATAGGEFADPVAVLATYRGKAAADVPVTATMITSDSADPLPNDRGPFFKDAKGQPVRTLTELKTDAEGRLTLPKIFADDQTGVFQLRLSTPEGTSLIVTLVVTAPIG